jgi:hypothetical protein
VLRAAAGAETVLAETDSAPPPPAIGKRTWIDATLCTPAAGEAGDALRLRIHFVSGTTYFTSIITDLDIP